MGGRQFGGQSPPSVHILPPIHTVKTDPKARSVNTGNGLTKNIAKICRRERSRRTNNARYFLSYRNEIHMYGIIFGIILPVDKYQHESPNIQRSSRIMDQDLTVWLNAWRGLYILTDIRLVG